MRLSQVCGLPVLDTGIARQAGAVAEVIVDPIASQIVALDVEHGDGFLQMRVPIEYVERIEPNRVLAIGTSELEFLPPQDWGERVVGTRALLGLLVVDENGEPIGHVADARFDLDSLGVTSYILAGPLFGSWIGGRRVAPDEVVGCSSEMMGVRLRAPARSKVDATAIKDGGAAMAAGASDLAGLPSRIARSVAALLGRLGHSRKDRESDA